MINIAHNYATWENHYGQNVQLEAKGIVHAIRSQDDMQEATGAYKDIEEVIANQTDLIKVKTRLLPIAVIKG
jgi:rtcB protein